MKQYDLIVIGAGPAGMAMATGCARGGLDVLLLDEQPQAGGQIWRGVERSRLRQTQVLDEDYWRGADEVAGLRLAHLTHQAGARVWHANAAGEIGFSIGGRAVLAQGKTVALGVGARERPVAVTGWTLPGVFTAGAAQVLLKGAAVTVGMSVLAGSGPLLYLLAAQYLRAGQRIRALLDTTPAHNYLEAAALLPGALAQRQFYKGLSMLARIRGAGVPVYNGVSDLRIEGKDAVCAVSWTRGRGNGRIACDAVLLHEGLVPNVELGLAMGCDWHWSAQRCAWELKTDGAGRTSLPNVYALGDCARIVGAQASTLQGRLAAANLLRERHGGPVTGEEKAWTRELAAQMRLRGFLDRLYRPRDAALLSTDSDTVVCRCEGLTVRDLTPLVSGAAGDPNFVKSLTRCGMGPCQGKMCSHSLTTLARREGVQTPFTPLRQRMPLAPITLDELAGLELPA